MFTMNPIHDYLVYIKYEVYLDRMNLVGKTHMHFVIRIPRALPCVFISMEATVYYIRV